MTLLISNSDTAKVLETKDAMAALEAAYADLGAKNAVCRPRIDISIPQDKGGKVYQWGTMEGGSMSGYFAIRMKSDVIYEHEYEGVRTQEKYCKEPGLFCGLVLLTSVETGEPLAILNDGLLQHVRVGADGGIGAKHMAREGAEVVGMLGSGGMARSHMAALMEVRPIKRVQVFSPTKANREAYAREMAETHGIEAVACETPEEVYAGAHIICGCTDSAVPIFLADRIEPGCHLMDVQSIPGPETLARVDAALRLGNATAPWGLDDFAITDRWITYGAAPDKAPDHKFKAMGQRGRPAIDDDKTVMLGELLSGARPGRTSDDQITYSERGNAQGAQFFAVAGMVYEKAKAAGLGHEIPTEWLLQDIRD
jgi:ornithine cyclodeaminase/alanine dehydrogenase-like protein (mu-crystallin family)